MSGIYTNDTIAALCTAPGGALSIIRLSGPQAFDTVKHVWFGNIRKLETNPRTLLFGHAPSPDGETCLAVFMPSPASYTGEDVCELQFHGGTVSAKRILSAVLANGARAAEPGEFTRRAFVNGKLDLTQAEAVCDIVAAKSERAFKLAQQRLSGALGKQIRSINEDMKHILADFESRLDFSEEDLDWMTQKEFTAIFNRITATLEKLVSTATYAALCRNGIPMAIAGPPNAGKSSLMNALLGFDRAIVTNIPGTTRDTLEESLTLRGIPLTMTDTAGLRAETADAIEHIGMERSRNAINTASIVLWMHDLENNKNETDDIHKMLSEIPNGVNAVFVRNKCDTISTLPPRNDELPDSIPCVDISAVNGTGLEKLADEIENLIAKNTDEPSDGNALEARHESLAANALQEIRQALDEAQNEAWELAASCLRNALFSLGSITGETTTPDVLDEIFARFCIGK